MSNTTNDATRQDAAARQPIRTLRISGRFTNADLNRFADLLREIDRDRPTELFTMTFIGGDETLEEGEALIQSLLPPLEDRITTFQTFATKEKP